MEKRNLKKGRKGMDLVHKNAEEINKRKEVKQLICTNLPDPWRIVTMLRAAPLTTRRKSLFRPTYLAYFYREITVAIRHFLPLPQEDDKDEAHSACIFDHCGGV